MAGRTSDFSTVAGRYDVTRDVPEQVLTSRYEALMQGGTLPRTGTILDAGCGTGQMSIPLLRSGLRVVGIDISEEMVRIAASKVKPGQSAHFKVGDARAIACDDDVFDGVVFSKLLMHVENWKNCCNEFVRVTKPGSHILHLIDRGTYADSVRREFTRRIDALGFKDRFPGAVSSSGEISAYMVSMGCEARAFRDDGLSWYRHVTRRESLACFTERLFAEFWYVPLDVYDRVLLETDAWSQAQPGGLDQTERLSGHLIIETYETPP